jgi:hypothetical protein
MALFFSEIIRLFYNQLIHFFCKIQVKWRVVSLFSGMISLSAILSKTISMIAGLWNLSVTWEDALSTFTEDINVYSNINIDKGTLEI